jgi:predicted  nucleic acid-binding Zn-ribbon protein
MMSQEEKDLATHVEICAIRYKGLEERMDGLESRLVKVETEIVNLKTEMAAGFHEIKLLLEKQNNTRSTQIIATFGTIIAAIIGVIGYLVTKH